jgi:hypothetical protein
MRDFEDFRTYYQDMNGYLTPASIGLEDNGQWVCAEDANKVLAA